MIEGVNNPNNKDKIAIVAVGYNRLYGLARLLDSLNESFYPKDDIPLIISIDASGDATLYKYVEDFQWKHGTKYVNIQQERLGLRSHIYKCGDLTQYFKAIALFEDDLWVSPYFYSYLIDTVDKYGKDERICEIALYKNERLGDQGFYFDQLHDGSDCFLWQDICTWGQCWTKQMWCGFKSWLATHDDNYIKGIDIPDSVKAWTRAWSKYFMAYEIDTNKYVLFPHESLTTNFNDAGGEHGGGSNVVQVNVLHGPRRYQYNDVDKMVRYDVYTNNESIYKWLPKPYAKETCLDIFGARSNFNGKRYVLSMKKLPFSAVKEWGLQMRPIELNILYDIKGKGIALYDLEQAVRTKGGFNNEFVPYMLRGLSNRLLLSYLLRYFINKILKRK